MLQNTMRALPGSRSGGRSTMAEKSLRSRGSMGSVIYYLRGPNAHDTGGRRNDPAASWPFARQRIFRRSGPRFAAEKYAPKQLKAGAASRSGTPPGSGLHPTAVATVVFTCWERRPDYFAAAAMRGQSAICSRATRTYVPFSARKIEASPSFTSNQSLPSASRMFGLWVTRTVLVPGLGGVPISLRIASARRAFSLGDTTRPPSVRSAVFSISAKPAIVAVSYARLNLLV